ncbi:DUF4870 domain-containing protein [Microbacterium gorillae]|uniref:DUF4870 domain-containing protein n=1 Tax=Microbacterium gorillae TaxID=1231063 RepID=UPI003D963F03
MSDPNGSQPQQPQEPQGAPQPPAQDPTQPGAYDPNAGQPTPPQPPQYEAPAAPQYSAPQEGVPQPPAYGAPQAPQAPQYGAPQPPQYGAPQAPQAPQYGAPQPPQYGAPQAPQYGAPQPPQYGAPQPGYGQPQYSGGGNPPYAPQQDQTMAMWAHLSGIFYIIPPLIIWLIGKDRGPRTNVEGKEAVNWQITLLIGQVAVTIVAAILTGILWSVGAWGVADIVGKLPWLLWVANVVFCILAAVKVNGGGSYRYPVNFRFIK